MSNLVPYLGGKNRLARNAHDKLLDVAKYIEENL